MNRSPIVLSRLTRRQFLTLGLGTAAAYTLPLLVGCRNQPDTQTPSVEDVLGTDGTVPLQPKVIASQNGVLATSLLMKMQPFTVGGTSVMLRTYGSPKTGVADPDPNTDADWDWAFPGPTLQVNPGDSIQIMLYNYLPIEQNINECEPEFYVTPQLDKFPNCFHENEATNIHYHGMHVDVGPHADNVFLVLYPNGQEDVHDMPGEIVAIGQYEFNFTVPLDHPQGTYWYHPHKHGATDLQVANGMAGAIIVQDTGNTFQDYADQILVIQRITETLPFPGGAGSGTIVLNGVQNPTLTMQAGEIQRWRFINATGQLANAFRIGFSGPADVVPEIYLIAVDGVYISNDEWETEESDGSVFLAPGNRVDVLVQAKEEGSFSILATQTHTNEKANATRTPVSTDAAAAPPAFLTLQVEGSLAQPMNLPAAMPDLPAQLAPIPNSEISRQRTLTFSLLEGQQGGAGHGQAPVFAIDGQLFDPCRVDQCLTAGEEWTVINSSPVAHPFHIHVNPFFITAYNDPALSPPPGTPVPTPTPPTAGGSPVGQWQDTLLVPAAANGQNGSVTFRHRFPTDITGKFVLHCHILGHEDRGMMQVVEIVPVGEECTACE